MFHSNAIVLQHPIEISLLSPFWMSLENIQARCGMYSNRELLTSQPSFVVQYVLTHMTV